MSVEEHCKTSGYVCQEFLKMLPPSITRFLPKGLPALVALHDVGKVCPGFLRKLLRKLLRRVLMTLSPELIRLKNDQTNYYEYHQTISESSVKKYLNVSDEISRIEGAHHGFRNEDPWLDEFSLYGGNSWSREREKLIRRITRTFGMPPTRIEGVWIDVCAGIVSLCDWISSNERYFSQRGGLTTRQIKNRARQVIKNLGWKRSRINRGMSFGDLFKTTDTVPIPFRPNPLQKLVGKIYKGQGIYLIEESTGNGKTEAALDLTYKLLQDSCHGGLLFALPTRITSDRIQTRVLAWMENAYKRGMAPRLIIWSMREQYL
jgi:CRISPR-associated endonuclease/helicase Cas3